jgi:transcriptional regulator with XRE-family HTH domain
MPAKSQTVNQLPHYSATNRDSRIGFVDRLRKMVADTGGQRAFAALVGVSQRAVSLWLEKTEPGRDRLAAIANQTGVSLDWLVTGRGPKFFSDVPPGYVAIDFYDLVKSGGYLNTLGGPDRLLIFDRSLLALDADENANLLALYLLPGETSESIVTASDFVIVDRGARDLIPASPSAVAEEERYRGGSIDLGILCATIEKGHAQTWIVRWGNKPKPMVIFESIGGSDKKRRRFERDEEMAVINILGPVRFRAAFIRPQIIQAAKQRGERQ